MSDTQVMPVFTPAAEAWLNEGGAERWDAANACWMNLSSAAHHKGAPLSRREVQRVVAEGRRWNDRAPDDHRPRDEDRDQDGGQP